MAFCCIVVVVACPHLSGGGGYRLQEELDQKVEELHEQADKVKQLERSKERAEAVAMRRDKSLQELMEKNR